MAAKAAALGALLLAAGVLAGCGGSSDRDPVDTTIGGGPAAAPASTGVDASSSTVVYLPPPYIARTQWVQTSVGPSLQVYPTPAGRRVTSPDAQGKAWREVLAKSGRYEQFSAHSPGMRAQFDCHWVWARAVQPDKPSWNLEPTRPVVTDDQMIASRCNPGAPEE